MSSRIMMKNSVVLICRTAVLSAVALVLSVFENMIPDIPFMLPGMKLGLSNLSVMFALEVCPLPCALCIVVVKALFALLTRGVTAFFMSLGGGLAATVAMWLVLKSKKMKFGCFGVGVAGAFVHNCGQLAVAYIFVSGAVFAYFPFLALSALVMGALTGLVYYVVMPRLLSLPLMA